MGNAGRFRLFSVAGQDPDQVPDVKPIDEVAGIFALRRIHTHVERGIKAMAEATRSRIELVGGDPEVQQQAVHPWDTFRLQKRGQVSEVAFEQDQPPCRYVCSKPFSGLGEGIIIPIDGHNAASRVQRLKQRLGVSAAAQGSIHVRADRVGHEVLDDIIPKNRRVIARSMFQEVPRVITRIHIVSVFCFDDSLRTP
jgi:hypothetical protein